MKKNEKNNLLKITICAVLAITITACSSKKEEKENKPEKPTPVVVEEPVEVYEETVKETPVNTITYGVQIGAYKMFDVEFQSDIKNIKKNGLSHYVVGNFTTKNEAEDLLKIMTDLGIKDAFVVKVGKE